MESFVFSYPTRVYFGSGAAKQALDSELGAYKKVMLAYGVASAKANGIYDEIRGALESLGKEVVDFGGITPNPKYTKVQEGAALARREQVDFILAVGGGSVSDCCKVISAQAVLDEDIWDYEYIRGKFPADGIPMGVVVTCSGTGSEMNCGAVITHEAKNWKGGIFATTARFAALDPAYTATVPRMQVFSGAFDTLSHAMETYFGASDSDNVSDDVALAVMRNTVVNMRRLLADADDMQARSNLMWDSAMAGERHPQGWPSHGLPGSPDRAPARRLHRLQPWPGPGGDPARVLQAYPRPTHRRNSPVSPGWSSALTRPRPGSTRLKRSYATAACPQSWVSWRPRRPSRPKSSARWPTAATSSSAIRAS